MFFDELHERNGIVQSILAFEKLKNKPELARPVSAGSDPELSFFFQKRPIKLEHPFST